ncbi:MAG: hypothetical protein QXP77_02275, partial [Candidatus Aenigmatarchaeota archaeon]
MGLSVRIKIVLYVVLVTLIPFIVMILFLLNSLIQASINIEKKTTDEVIFLLKQNLLNNVDLKAQLYDITF